MPAFLPKLAPLVMALVLGAVAGGCDHAAVEPAVKDDERRRSPTTPAPATPPAPTSPSPAPSADCPAPEARVRADRAGARRVTVGDEPRQTISHWGASVVSDSWVDPLVQPSGLSGTALRELDRRVFRDAGVSVVRVFGPGYGRAPLEADAASRAKDRSIAFMRRVAPYGVRFMFTGADAPPRMKQGKRLRAGSELAYAAYVADYLDTARALGVPFSYAAIANEPDHGASRLQITPAQAVLVYRRLAREIERRGLGVRLILGDTFGWDAACGYATALTADPEVRATAEAVATHPYGGSLGAARGLAARAGAAGLPVWQTEWGNGCPTCPDTGGVHQAILWSREIAEGLEVGSASAWFAFRAVADVKHGPGDALLVRDRSPEARSPFYASKRFHVFRQYSTVAPPGTRVLPVSELVHDVIAVAFEREGPRSVVLTNTGRAKRRVELDLGATAGELSIRRTSGTEDFRALRPLRYAGRPAEVELPGDSVTTLTLR